MDFPSGASGKEHTCKCRRPRFDPWVWKIPWRRGEFSSILAWRIPWTEEPGGLQFLSHKELDTTEWLTLPHFSHDIGARY